MRPGCGSQAKRIQATPQELVQSSQFTLRQNLSRPSVQFQCARQLHPSLVGGSQFGHLIDECARACSIVCLHRARFDGVIYKLESVIREVGNLLRGRTLEKSKFLCVYYFQAGQE